MTDVETFYNGARMTRSNDRFRAVNLLSVTLGTKNYARTFGIDKNFFIDTEFELAPETFTAHITKRLSDYAISPTGVETVIDDFISHINIRIRK